MRKLFKERKNSVNKGKRNVRPGILFLIFKNRYEHLLSIVGPELQRHLREPISSSERLTLSSRYLAIGESQHREPISPSERLTFTLQYLASGDSQQSLGFAFRINRTAISNILADKWETFI